MMIVIAGGGLVGGALVRELVENKHDVVLLDANKERCDALYAETGVMAVHGNAARIHALREADADKADVLVAATGSDADNLTCAILAKSLGVPRVVVRMRDPGYAEAYRLADVDSIVRVTDLMVNHMMVEVEQPNVRRVMSIGGGRADIYRLVIPKNATQAGRTIQDIAKDRKFPEECVFAALVKEDEDKVAIPHGGTVVEEGDEAFLISAAGDIKQAVDLLLETKE